MSLVQENYLPRLLDGVIERRLATFGALEVAGAKFCGKTWASMAHANSIVHIDDDAVRQMVEVDVSLALEGEKPHVIDEWQDVPKIWDATRRAVDMSGGKRGQYILTGSSTVDKSKVSHSGAGRIANVRMRPMSLFEAGKSTGAVSLAKLFEGECPTVQVDTGVRELADCICRGGWPASLDAPDALVGDLPAQYLQVLFEVSASKQGLDPRMARRVAVSLARNMGKTVTYKAIYGETSEGEPQSGMSSSLFRQAIEPYLSFFESQYFIEDQAGWDAPVKAKSRVKLKPRRTFVDPSLPASLLALSPDRLLRERQLFGNLFEELCLRDLRVYASALPCIPEPSVFYYADADGLEVDAVVELPDGRWGAFEVKLSEDKVPQAEESLMRLQAKIKNNPAAQNRDASFLAVLVGKASFARTTPNGVFVVPVTCFGA